MCRQNFLICKSKVILSDKFNKLIFYITGCVYSTPPTQPTRLFPTFIYSTHTV